MCLWLYLKIKFNTLAIHIVLLLFLSVVIIEERFCFAILLAALASKTISLVPHFIDEYFEFCLQKKLFAFVFHLTKNTLAIM